MSMISITLWISSLFTFGFASGQTESLHPKHIDTTSIASDFNFGYDLENPDLVLEMPDKLKEISGIGLATDGKNLVAVQDENGIIFTLDKKTGAIVSEVEFWKDGDYEGAEMVDNATYIVKSTGTIYKVTDAGSAEQKVEKFNFFLDKDNDVEGLCLDASRKCLLLACKAKAGHGDHYNRKKGIYAFHLDRLTIDSIPVFTFSMDDILTYLETKPKINRLDKIIEFFDPSSDELPFSPSGIAIHPITGDIYISSAVGKLLLITDKNGKVLHIEKLRKSIHPQPEGICFDSNGDLYIANEGKKEVAARIYRFNYKN